MAGKDVRGERPESRPGFTPSGPPDEAFGSRAAGVGGSA